MTLLAILVLIIKSPLLILGFLFKHKILLLIAIVGVVAIFVLPSFNKSNNPSITQNTQIPSYQYSAPDINKAPYVIATTSRVYYTVSYEDDGETVTLNDYYFYDAKKWRRQTNPLSLNRGAYGEIRIYVR